MELQQNKEIQSDRRRFYKNGKQVVENIIDLILPPRCAISGDVVSAQGQIAPEQWKKLEFISDPQCIICGHPFDFQLQADMECASCLQDRPEFDKARSALVYSDTSRDLVLRYKHTDQLHIIHSFMPWVVRAGEALINKADLILPVPLHRWRLMKRRYNQAALMAQYLSKKCCKPWAYDVLTRAHSTKTQGYMNVKERRKNVKNAFNVRDVKKPEVEGKTILLVDDVYTTGATVRECTKTLLKAGAENVNVLTITKIVKR